MRLAELCAATGVPSATVKYYLREGLLPPRASGCRRRGRSTARSTSSGSG